MARDGKRKDVKVIITAETLLPEMVTQYPATRKVLDKYGLKGCGGPTGPREPVAWFARLHNVPLQQLLDELNQAARESLEAERATVRFEPTIADIIYQPFFASAAAFAVVFGALWGAVSLAVMGISGDMQFAVPYGWLLAHGQGMLGGFVVLIAMGFAYQAFPRFKHSELRLPKLAIAVLPLILAGLSFQVVAHFFVPANIF
ncbi:MAG: NnrS family protein [Candidatus Fervidibacter sp.]|uniref:NnrS family protein n=1 Tax=Candidatus Fervidibacter sp. TaxID=3100871 RepID=UPI00404AC939